MYKIFSKSETYRFPNGETMLGSDMVKMESYAILNSGVFAVDNAGNILHSFTPLEQLAEQYGVEYTDDHEAVLSKVNSALLKENQISMDRASSEEALYTVARMYASTLSADKQNEVKDIFPDYTTCVGKKLKNGDIVQYLGSLYKINVDFTVTEEILPGTSYGVGYFILIGSSQFPVWSKPDKPENGYMSGDIVEHDGALYISMVDYNDSEPGKDTEKWNSYVKTW